MSNQTKYAPPGEFAAVWSNRPGNSAKQIRSASGLSENWIANRVTGRVKPTTEDVQKLRGAIALVEAMASSVPSKHSTNYRLICRVVELFGQGFSGLAVLDMIKYEFPSTAIDGVELLAIKRRFELQVASLATVARLSVDVYKQSSERISAEIQHALWQEQLRAV